MRDLLLFYFLSFFLKFLEDISPFVGLLVPLFWTSCDICPFFWPWWTPCLHASSPACNGFLPLLQHLLTSWVPAWQLNHIHILVHGSSIGGTKTWDHVCIPCWQICILIKTYSHYTEKVQTKSQVSVISNNLSFGLLHNDFADFNVSWEEKENHKTSYLCFKKWMEKGIGNNTCDQEVCRCWTRDESEESIPCVKRSTQATGSTLTLNVTKSTKQGYQWSHKKDWCTQIYFLKTTATLENPKVTHPKKQNRNAFVSGRKCELWWNRTICTLFPSRIQIIVHNVAIQLI